MTTVLRAASAAQFLTLVPRLLGFVPRHSLALVPFHGSRSIGAMRFDLPDSVDPVELAGFAATAVGIACRIPDADGLALVVYADATTGEHPPHDALADAVRTRMEECGLALLDALWVAPDGWGAFDGSARGGPPDELGDPSSDVELDVDQVSAAVIVDADPARRECTARALRGLRSAVTVLCGSDASGAPVDAADDDDARIDPRAFETALRLDDLPTLFEDALTWPPASLDPYAAAALAWCLDRPAVRDIALVQWCRGSQAGDEALDAQLRWEQGEEYPPHLAMFLWGEGAQPRPERLAAALEVVRAVATLAPDEATSGPLATAAWLSWALGRSTHAERHAREALTIHPEHGLAEIVLSFVGAGHLPDWAFRRR